MIENGAIVSARRVCQRASDPTFTDAGRSDDDQVLMPIDPVSGGQLGEQCLVEPARRLHINVLDDGVLSKSGELQSTGKPLVLAFDRLAIDEHGESLLERESGKVGQSSLLLERLRHAGEAERNEPLFGWMCEHFVPFLFTRLQVVSAALLSGSSQSHGCCRAGSAGRPASVRLRRLCRAHA